MFVQRPLYPIQFRMQTTFLLRTIMLLVYTNVVVAHHEILEAIYISLLGIYVPECYLVPFFPYTYTHTHTDRILSRINARTSKE